MPESLPTPSGTSEAPVLGGLTLPEFLEELWQDAVTPTSMLQTWTLQGRRLEQWNSRQGARDIAGRSDVFMGAALTLKRLPPTQRPNAAHSVCIPGMWADIDINGTPDGKGGVKAGAARDLEHALQIASLIAEPTIVVHSGHGIQAWWLLHSPWKFTSAPEQAAGATLAARWGAELRTKALATGARLDSVHDLARLMRPPGTINAKAAPVPVMTLGGVAYRYTLQELQDLVAHRTETIDRVTPGGATRPGGTLTPVAMDDTLRARVDAACAASPDLAGAWAGSLPRAMGWTQSQSDLALATRLARVTNPLTGGPLFSDPEIAAAVRAHRLAMRPGDPASIAKAHRDRYLELTVEAARRSAETYAATRAVDEPESTSVLRQITERGRAA